MKRAILCLFVVAVVLPGWGREQTGSFTIDVSGQKTWTIRYGIGSPAALASEGLYPGQLYLDQSLRADITGTALGFITLEANFDDKLGPGFQHFVLKVDRDPWHGLLGDFYVGRGELGVYNKKLLGAKLSFEGDGITASALAARLEGISESRTFKGQAAQAEVTFSYRDPERPWEPAPYLVNLDGPYFWDLRAPFVEGFSQVVLSLDEGQGLAGYLADYGLEYLMEALEEDQELSQGNYLVLRDGGDVLILKAAPGDLLRSRVQDAIDLYNREHDLTGADRKAYPFVRGSELERAFLSGLEAFAALRVDGEQYAFAAAGHRGYLLLGERDVIEDSLQIEVMPAGGPGFLPISDPRFADYAWELYPDEGVLKIAFPDDFFQPGAALHVAFRYRRTGDVFMLGLSVVPGSERVYLNGKQLSRGTDYTIDYETGVLVLFTSLTEDDELRVDFERQRGGLGGYSEYERMFLGGTISVPGYEGLEATLWRALDLGRPGPATRVMPGSHTVGGLRMVGSSGGWDYNLSFGASENVFPPGDNERIAAPNRINAIASAESPDGEYVVFAHQNGLTVYHAGGFSAYGGAQGLGGRAVRDLLALPGMLLCATDAGLTVVYLTDPAPFDRVASWTRVYPEDGLPGEEAFALARGGGLVYLATDAAVATFPREGVESPDDWDTLPLPEGAGRPRVLLYREDGLLLGTESGLYRWTGGAWELLPDVPGPVYDLLEEDGVLYAATGGGVRVVRDGTPSGWLSLTPAYALASFRGEVWWGGEEGLFHQGEVGPRVQGAITALLGDDVLWAGGRAEPGEDGYRLDLWRLSPDPERIPQDATHIDGRDLGHFTDPPAGQHTARGITGALALSREMGEWRISLNAGTRWPGYQAIGGAGSSDSHGLGFTAHYQGKGATVDISGNWRLVDLFSSPRGELTGSLQASWEKGGKWTLSISPAFSPDRGRLEAGYKLQASWPGDGLSGGISLAGQLVAPDWYAGGKLSANLDWRPLPELEISGGFVRPYRTRGTSGEETLSLDATWTGGSEGLAWTVRAATTIVHRLAGGGWQAKLDLKWDLRWSPWDIEGGRFTPQASLRFQRSREETSWTVGGSGRLQLGDNDFRIGISFGQGYRPATQRQARNLELSLRWGYSGWEGVEPTFTWKRSWQLLSHPRYGDRLTEKGEASLRVSWRSEAGWQNDLTLNFKGEAGGMGLTDRFSFPLEVGALSAQASATLKQGKLDGKLTASYGVPVAEGWDMSAELGYAFGGELGTGIQHGLFGQVSLIATF